MNHFAKIYVLQNLLDGRPGNYGLRRITEMRGYKFTAQALIDDGLAAIDKFGALSITDAGRRIVAEHTARRRPRQPSPRPERVLTPSQD